MTRKNSSKQLVSFENSYSQRLKEIVEKSIKEERTIMDEVRHPQSEPATFGQKVADRVASFGGSWKFIILFGFFLLAWISFNVLAFQRWRFDPYPFILMNLVLSCIAALQAPIIMMSQNRQEEKDRCRSENDYMVNLKAEMQIRSLHEKLDLLEQEEIKSIFEMQEKQMQLLRSIERRLETLKPQ